MTADEGKPLVANTARGLGVRVGSQLEDDIAVDDSRDVHPNSGGMSVAPEWRELEVHRIPKRLKYIVPDARGSNRDACWRMGDGPFDSGPMSEGLVLRKNNDVHGYVEPIQSMKADEYVAALVATRDLWVIDEE